MNIDEKIADLEKQLAEAKRQKELENGIWKPKNEFYYITEYGDVFSRCNEHYCFDNKIIECGNYYKTREEAEYQANIQKYTNLFRKYVEEHSDKLDWKNSNQEKYCICNECSSKLLFTESYYRKKEQGTIYASSEQVLQNAVDFVGKENVIKYVLGVGK